VSIVLDASIAIAWAVPDEDEPLADTVMGLVGSEGAVVPVLWFWETANIVLVKLRRGKLEEAEVETILRSFRRLPIAHDPDVTPQVFADAFALARKHRLTTYDAAYLELALRRGLPLASLDGALLAAARAEGLATVGTIRR